MIFNALYRDLGIKYIHDGGVVSAALLTTHNQARELLQNAIDASRSEATGSLNIIIEELRSDTGKPIQSVITLTNNGPFPADMVRADGEPRSYLEYLDGRLRHPSSASDTSRRTQSQPEHS